MDAIRYFSEIDSLQRYFNSRKDDTPTKGFVDLLGSIIIRHTGYFKRPDQCLVDLGCGDGQVLAALINYLGFKKAIGVDVSEHMLSRLDASMKSKFRRITTTFRVNLNTELLPIPDRTAALVTSLGTMMYIDSLPHVFSEVARIMRINAYFCFTVITSDKETYAYQSHESTPLYYVHRMSDLKKMIESFGFVIEADIHIQEPYLVNVNEKGKDHPRTLIVRKIKK